MHLRGGLRSGTSTTVGTLPAGFRPAVEIYAISWGYNVNGPAYVRIDPSGAVLVFSQTGAATDYTKDFTSLEGVTFQAAP